MLLIPAIDLKDGQCVRLKQGVMDGATVFSENPAAMARHWIDQGARRLHLVDLNGAFAGKPKNEPAIKAILAGSRRGNSGPARRRHPRPRHHRALPRRRHQLRHHRHGGGEEPRLPARRLHGLSRPHHRRPRCQGRQGGGGRLVENDRPRRHRPGEEVRGLWRRGGDLHRHRSRRHALGRQCRGHRQAGAGAEDSGHRLRRHRQPG